MVFITVVERVYCAVRTDSLYKADYVSSLKGYIYQKHDIKHMWLVEKFEWLQVSTAKWLRTAFFGVNTQRVITQMKALIGRDTCQMHGIGHT